MFRTSPTPSARRPLSVAFMLTACLGLLAPQAEAAKTLSDDEITQAVDAQLIQDPMVNGFNVDTTTQQGIVTLTGQAENLLAKERATKVAEAIRGVRAVVNNMVVDVPLRPDRAVRTDVVNALLYDRATESFQIDVTVQEQVVTLKGDVDSWQEKQLAEQVAKGVRGVKDVKNEMRVDYGEPRSDSQIKAEIEKALRNDVLVDDALIDVAVEDGVVTLSGTVGSAAEKRLARGDAYVTGVLRVDTGGLNVAHWARNPDLRKDKYVSKTDQELDRAVKDALLYDPRANSFEINVSSDQGVVTLTGTVDTVAAKQAAAQDARNTVGVWRVKNQIKVRDSSNLSDAEIERNLEDALLRDAMVDRYEIAATVYNGKAILTGTVDSYLEKVRANTLAATTRGVTRVKNHLQVDATEPLTYDPYVDTYDYLYDGTWYTPPTTATLKSDWEIRDDIKDELWWSPFVDADEVTVTVDNGKAILTGNVDTWSERRAASENAIEGGAISVENKLTVDYGPDYYLDENEGS